MSDSPASSVPSVDATPRRADIQGLRAVAVLLVVAYHSRIGVSAGFVGVDVFFVVSGFVITQLLHRELQSTGTIRLRSFYGRRARRLLPALAVMIVTVLVISALVTNPLDAQPFVVQTAVAAQAFVANLFLYRHVGYFDPIGANNPFLHTWTLSIEEQFYLGFPVLLMAASLRRRGNGRTTWVLVAALALSLTMAVLMTTGTLSFGFSVPTRLAYYAAPTRAWEFLAGAVLATNWRRVSAWAASRAALLGAVGLALVAASLIVSRNPGESASGIPALPVLGALALLAAGSGQNLVTRALSVRPLVALGDRSYAWYLWHWPAIALSATVWPGQRWVLPVAGVAALVPAHLSTRFVEQPLRLRSAGRVRSARLTTACAMVALLVSAIVWSGAQNGWGLDIPNGWYAYPSGRSNGCTLFNRDIANTWNEANCSTPAEPGRGTVLVLGDLQADGVSPGVILAASRLGLGTAVWDRADCPFAGRTPSDYPQCDRWNRDALALVDRIRPSAVVIANDATAYIDGDGGTPLGDRDGHPVRDRATALAEWGAGVDQTLDELQRRDVPVIWVSSVPDYGQSFPRGRISVVRPSLDVAPLDRDAVVRARSDVVEVERNAMERHRGVEVVDPVDVLCSTSCRPSHRGVWWYYDSNNLTVAGGERLGPEIERALRRTTGADS